MSSTVRQPLVHYDRKRDLYWARVELPPGPDGTRRRPRVTSRDKAELGRKLRKLLDEIDRGTVRKTKGYTVRSWSDYYLAHYAPEKSAATYRDVLNNWCLPYLPRAGNLRLDRLTHEHVDAMLAKLKRRGLSNGSRVKARNVLSSVLKAAHLRHEVRENVARLAIAPPTEHATKDALTVPEVERAHLVGLLHRFHLRSGGPHQVGPSAVMELHDVSPGYAEIAAFWRLASFRAVALHPLRRIAKVGVAGSNPVVRSEKYLIRGPAASSQRALVA